MSFEYDSEAAKRRSDDYHISILYIIRMYYANASEFYEPANSMSLRIL
jgi:hypothetical protein